MRVPTIKIQTRKATLQLKVKNLKTGSSVDKNKCLDNWFKLIYNCDRQTRSMSKLIKDLGNIIIYETYRCMPLLGNEKVNAPDWEEHIARYHIGFVRKS